MRKRKARDHSAVGLVHQVTTSVAFVLLMLGSARAPTISWSALRPQLSQQDELNSALPPSPGEVFLTRFFQAMALITVRFPATRLQSDTIPSFLMNSPKATQFQRSRPPCRQGSGSPKSAEKNPLTIAKG